MRMDKLTHSLQAVLGEAQSLAIGRDHPFIEPLHLLKAMLDPAGSATRPLLMAAGAAVEPLQASVGAHWRQWRRFRAVRTFTSARKPSGC